MGVHSIVRTVLITLLILPSVAMRAHSTTQEGATSVAALYEYLGTINGERGPHGPVICFPRGVSDLRSSDEWAEEPQRRAVIKEAISALVARAGAAHTDSGRPDEPLQFRVTGFADQEGNEEHNLALSYRRAESIKELIKDGSFESRVG